MAKGVLLQALPIGSNVTLKNAKKGKYFRLVASVNSRHAMGDVATLVMNEGLAVPYKGTGKRYNWCKSTDLHELKIQKRISECFCRDT